MNTYLRWGNWTLWRTAGFFSMITRNFTGCPSMWSMIMNWWPRFPCFTHTVRVLYAKSNTIFYYLYHLRACNILHPNMDTYLYKWMTTLISPTSIVPVWPPHRAVIVGVHILFVFRPDYLFFLALCTNDIRSESMELWINNQLSSISLHANICFISTKLLRLLKVLNTSEWHLLDSSLNTDKNFSNHAYGLTANRATDQQGAAYGTEHWFLVYFTPLSIHNHPCTLNRYSFWSVYRKNKLSVSINRIYNISCQSAFSIGTLIQWKLKDWRLGIRRSSIKHRHQGKLNVPDIHVKKIEGYQKNCLQHNITALQKRKDQRDGMVMQYTQWRQTEYQRSLNINRSVNNG